MSAGLELVIFDCDGVLVDTEHAAVDVDLVVLAAMGWTMPRDEVIERFVGQTHASMTAQLAAHLGRELADDWDSPFAHLYVEALRVVAPVPGIVAALDQISLPTCVASSGGHQKMRHTLGSVGLYERFAGRIFSATEVAYGKPAPDLFLHAARQMGCLPQRCAVVEDSAAGVAAGIAAGMAVFAYGSGVTPAHRLTGANVTVFNDMAELPGLLAEGAAAAAASR